MVRVAVTGAAGKVGRVTVDALADDHDVGPIYHPDHGREDGVAADIRDREEIAGALADADAVVHLAAEPAPDAGWDRVLRPNVDGTYNVYEAARRNGLDRVIFASTNHVVQMYNVDDPADPASASDRARAIDHDDPVRPDSYYAVSKVCGEALGNYYADRHGLSVVNLRIGGLLTPDELRERQADREAVARYARAMYLSYRDCGHAMRRAVAADLAATPLTVNLTSGNAERYLSLTHTMRRLGYAPADDSAPVLDRD